MLNELIKNNFQYDPESGIVSDKFGIFEFTVIKPNGKKYLRTTIGNRQFLAHRIAWFIHSGEWPKCQIDHINGNGVDNRIKNLRDVSNSENQKNRRLASNNKTGISGVYLYKNGFKSQIKSNRKNHHLGTFVDFFEACCARKSAENKFGFHSNHGSVRDL